MFVPALIAVACVPTLCVGTATSSKSIVNVTAPSVSPACITRVAVQSSPMVFVIASAGFPSIVTAGVKSVLSSSSLAVNETVTVSPSFAHAVPSFALLDEIETAVRTGATPSTAVTVMGVTASTPLRSVNVPVLVNVTSGVASVGMVATVSSTTLSELSSAADNAKPTTVNSVPRSLTVAPSIFSLHVVSMRVVVIVRAESITGPAASTDTSENGMMVFPARSVATLPYSSVFASVPATCVPKVRTMVLSFGVAPVEVAVGLMPSIAKSVSTTVESSISSVNTSVAVSIEPFSSKSSVVTLAIIAAIVSTSKSLISSVALVFPAASVTVKSQSVYVASARSPPAAASSVIVLLPSMGTVGVALHDPV